MNVVGKKINIKGIVQGVGFRPFIYRIALEHGVAGSVVNNVEGVCIEVEGEKEAIDSFITKIKKQSPPLAIIDEVTISDIGTGKHNGFTIGRSGSRNGQFTLISPDITICDECLAELFDPQDRRYRYPFINCTNCGPRFTIIHNLPYDREYTTMSSFLMCRRCKSEYHDPVDRRFHAQPNSCHDCGPQVQLLNGSTPLFYGDKAILETARYLLNGKIVAIKGIGGYHLACNALDRNAAARLRERKYRIEKPFAVMIPDENWLPAISITEDAERAFLHSIQRPIVLVKRRKDSPVSADTAPGNRYIGVMLPYTPLHYLIMKETGIPLVMTSGNKSEEPIACSEKETFEKLGKIADYFLIHNREIDTRCDDSVGTIIAGKESIIRRSRGYVPYPIKIHFKTTQTVLAVGGHLKNTFCLLNENYAFLSHHIGDLENYETLKSFDEGISRFQNLFSLQPEIVAYDLHPDYLSTSYALDLKVPVKIPVQHHHAHIVSCMTENKISGEVIGVAFDGNGYGTDGNIWGGEFLIVTPENFTRSAHLTYFPLPGGEAAIKQPWRSAVSLLYLLFGSNYRDIAPVFMEKLSGREQKQLDIIERMVSRNINSPLTSAAGRLFDAVAALCGIRKIVNYEAQAAIELQTAADEPEDRSYSFELNEDLSPIRIGYKGIIKGILSDLDNRTPVSTIAGKFHNTVADIIIAASEKIRKDTGINVICLSGGVFQNELLVRKTITKLSGAGFKYYIHSSVPANDGGLSLGQAVIAVNKHQRR